MKNFRRGRKAILTMIKKCKYKEILQKVKNLSSNRKTITILTSSEGSFVAETSVACLLQDLEARKLPKTAKLGVMYHIHDVIGADLVER